MIDGQPDMTVVGEAEDGARALERVRALDPDVVIMDVSMPGLNGVEATRTAHETCPRSKLVTLTRHREVGYLQLLMKAGASAYILKQSPPAELLNAIRVVAAGRTYIDRSIEPLAATPVHRAAVSTGGDDPLSARESQVLRLIAWGHSNKEIASQLDVSVKTIETHKANAMHKLGLQGRIDIVRYAILHGWLQET